VDSACYPSDLGSTKSEGTCPSDSALAFGDEATRRRECRRRTPAAGVAPELGPGDRGLVEDADGNGFSSPLYRADGSQRLVYVPIPAGNTCADIADATAVCGTRHLFVTPEHTEDWMLSLPNTGAYEQEVLWQGALGPYVDTRAQHLEARLVLAAMLAATAWYAKPQLGHRLRALRRLAPMVLGGQQTMGCCPTHWITPACAGQSPS